MTEQEIRSAFAEIIELRDNANKKENELIKRLGEEGVLWPMDTILLSSGLANFGGRDNGRMLEALVLSAMQRENVEQDEHDRKD